MSDATLAAAAKRLIEKHGRPCTFSRQGQVAADSQKPWRAPTTTPGAEGPLSYTGVKAVVTQEEIADEKGNGVKRGSMVIMVADESFPDGHVDIATLDHVNDGTRTWRIWKLYPIMPGTTPLIYKGDLEG